MELIDEQRLICERYRSAYFDAPLHLKVGVSANIREGFYPINGLRHPPEGDTTGWYIWAGEFSEDPDFFLPLHAGHLKEWCPKVLKHLASAPGWRFLIAPNYEDVWQDARLLNI